MVNAPFVTRCLCDGQVRHGGRRNGNFEPSIANQTWENWMKLVKTSAIAFAISALLAGPVLAQGVSSDTQTRGGAQGRSNMQGGVSGSGDEEFDAQTGAPGAKAGVNAKTGAKGTVGAGGGTVRGTGNAAGTVGDPAAGGKR
jgi:hypothetical protein